jgi:hypothetical protein
MLMLGPQPIDALRVVSVAVGLISERRIRPPKISTAAKIQIDRLLGTSGLGVLLWVVSEGFEHLIVCHCDDIINDVTSDTTLTIGFLPSDSHGCRTLAATTLFCSQTTILIVIPTLSI